MKSYFYHVLLAVRPAGVASFLKKLLRIKRRVVKSQSGISYFIDPVTQFGIQIYDRGIYERPLTQVLEAALRPGDTFIDIGANEGYFSILAGTKVGPGRVLAIEPQSRLQPILRKNIDLNQLRNVTVCQCACGTRAGEVTLHVAHDVNSGSSGITKYWRFRSATEKVRLTTLDDICRVNEIHQVRLIKIDVEGAEGEVLKGAAELIQQHKVDFLDVEFHEFITGDTIPREIDHRLRSAGYLTTRFPNGASLYHLPGKELELRELGREPAPELKRSHAAGG